MKSCIVKPANNEKHPKKNKNGKTTRKKNFFDKELQLISMIHFWVFIMPKQEFPTKICLGQFLPFIVI